MSRIRTIQPGFAKSPSIGRVSRDARLLFIQLWTVADDAGRLNADLRFLLDQLYPYDTDVAMFVPSWLDELEREGCIERYDGDGADCLRVVRWRKYQKIDHPTPSNLPASPRERLVDSRIREASRKLRGGKRKMQSAQDLDDESCRFRENGDFSAGGGGPVVVTHDALLRDLERIQSNAEADRSHSNSLRSVAMRAQLGLPAGKAAPNPGEPDSLSPAAIHGLAGTTRTGQ